MGTLLALASALAYGVSDFLGGVASRRIWFLRAALLGQVGGLVSMAVLAPLISTTVPASADVVWGGLSGVGTGMAMMFLFRGMGRGAMSVVVPTSAVGGVAIPVLVGVVAVGERPAPLAWTGIVLALPALWAVSRGQRDGGHRFEAAVGDGLLSSVGIALQYLALAQAGPASGIWAVVAGRVTAVITLVVLRRVLRVAVPETPSSRTRMDAVAVVAGVLAGVALTAYLFATRRELLAVAVVLSSLYPVVPVLLGITVLRERLTRQQSVGLAGALAATVFTLRADGPADTDENRWGIASSSWRSKTEPQERPMIDLIPATRETAAVIANLGDDRLGSPTPCPSYTLGDLLEHMDGLARAFTDAATKNIPVGGTQPPSVDAARLEPGWSTRIPELLDALADAWKDPAAWEGMTQAGGVDLPGEIAGLVALNEVIVHGWDIARASGQAYVADPAHVEICMEAMGPQPGEERPVGSDVAFGRPVDAPADAPPIDRLVALLGRDPAWTPESH